MLANRVLIFWGFLYLGALVYLMGFGMLWGFYCLIWFLFLFLSCFYVFSFFRGFYFLIFWCFFDVFLIFLWFFLLAFALLLLTKMGTFFKILLQFFFFGLYWLALMRWPVTSHRVKFTALRLVFNSYMQKYKKV